VAKRMRACSDAPSTSRRYQEWMPSTRSTVHGFESDTEGDCHACVTLPAVLAVSGTAEAAIRVAVEDGTGRGGGAAAVLQLNDDSFFDFDATLSPCLQVAQAKRYSGENHDPDRIYDHV
jgi:hypothetical protein